MGQTLASVRQYVDSLELPPMPKRTRAGTASPPAFTETPQVVGVGAQLAEFTDKVPSELRPLIANTMLLAQLAANKASSDTPNVFDWYGKYRSVLENVGWTVQGSEEEKREVTQKNAGLHKALIPVIASMLGPQVAALSLIVRLLQGLQDMDAQSPWITLFDRASQHARGAKFQISYVDADSGGSPTISLLCFAIEAERTVTQVLFFKFSSEKADLHQSTARLLVTRDRLQTDQQLIENKVGAFIAEFVNNIEI